MPEPVGTEVLIIYAVGLFSNDGLSLNLSKFRVGFYNISSMISVVSAAIRLH